MTIEGSGQIQLKWSVSSENNWDKLLIKRNGTALSNVNNVSGTKNGTETITVSDGTLLL